jgi:hypothetical protein
MGVPALRMGERSMGRPQDEDDDRFAEDARAFRDGRSCFF